MTSWDRRAPSAAGRKSLCWSVDGVRKEMGKIAQGLGESRRIAHEMTAQVSMWFSHKESIAKGIRITAEGRVTWGDRLKRWSEGL